MPDFEGSVSTQDNPIPRSMQDLSEFVFINMAIVIHLRRDSYLDL